MADLHRKVLGENVRKFRQRLNWSQEKLAERADMHWTFISGVERGKYNISLDSLARIAKALRRQPYELLR
jgi:transcriptional regulator with XRE-family HTH domain